MVFADALEQADLIALRVLAIAGGGFALRSPGDAAGQGEAPISTTDSTPSGMDSAMKLPGGTAPVRMKGRTAKLPSIMKASASGIAAAVHVRR